MKAQDYLVWMKYSFSKLKIEVSSTQAGKAGKES